MKIMPYRRAVVIGTGCAGYNAAGCLFREGVRDVAILTEGRLCGTSRNTGSDKQTYYKVSLSGNEGDSAYQTAKTLFGGGSADGDTAMCEAAYSLPCFFRLGALGVPFPRNRYGEYVGYRTDHDAFSRATSVGPYTSKRMTEVLESFAEECGIPVYDGMRAVCIVKNGERAAGVLALDSASCEDDFGLTFFPCGNVVLATGGPAAVYRDSVYPLSQRGASSLALFAGCRFVNVAEWQYGLASVQFRWNVSGTYQQVLPRYISVDEKGNEHEFLNEFYADPFGAVNAVFLKGYEWPFDSAKTQGSSRIDLLVYRETVERGRRVFMDFTREPSCMEKNGFAGLSEAARSYLSRSGALIPLPVHRLNAMNPKAAALYAAHGIDLARQPLEIAVCAQHNNGGIEVDTDWQTSVPGLYAAGECAGTHGVIRPGGSALNAGQVAGMRIAEHIARQRDAGEAASGCEEQAERVRAFIRRTHGKKSTLRAFTERMQACMSAHCAFRRQVRALREASAVFRAALCGFAEENTWADVQELPHLFAALDMVAVQAAYTDGMLYAAEYAGTRGGALVLGEDGKPVPENAAYRGRRILTQLRGGEFVSFERDVRPFPEERELWFETVWKQYEEERGH